MVHMWQALKLESSYSAYPKYLFLIMHSEVHSIPYPVISMMDFWQVASQFMFSQLFYSKKWMLISIEPCCSKKK